MNQARSVIGRWSGRIEGMVLHKAGMAIDDVRDGDIVTYEKGQQCEPGYERAVMRVVEREHAGFDEVTLRGLRRCLNVGGWSLVAVDRPKPVVPSHAGAMAFVDGGVAVCDGGDDSEWATVSTGLPGAGGWAEAPLGGNPVEAIPVPAEALRSLAYADTVWLGGMNDDELIGALNAFRVACIRGWARSGIVGPFRQ